jgi:hypothetical protein
MFAHNEPVYRALALRYGGDFDGNRYGAAPPSTAKIGRRRLAKPIDDTRGGPAHTRVGGVPLMSPHHPLHPLNTIIIPPLHPHSALLIPPPSYGVRAPVIPPEYPFDTPAIPPEYCSVTSAKCAGARYVILHTAHPRLLSHLSTTARRGLHPPHCKVNPRVSSETCASIDVASVS